MQRQALRQSAKTRKSVSKKESQSWRPANALRDLRQGWQDYRELWLTVGWYDIAKRYRRSVLGPFWITISLGAFIVGLCFLYVPLLGGSLSTYAPYVALGFVAWRLISDIVSESCNVFVSNSSLIVQLNAPLSIYIYGMIWRNALIFMHNMLIYIVVVVIFAVYPTWTTLLIIPGLALIAVNSVSLGMLLGSLCARFRDIPPVVATIIQMMFLLTPIMWRPEQVEGRRWVVILNPFYYFLELIRAPLLGDAPTLFVWTVALCITIVGLVAAIPFYARFRDRIAFWV